jgi:hypothetical protein
MSVISGPASCERPLSVRALTSSATTSPPALTNPRRPSGVIATARDGPGSGRRAATWRVVMSSSVSSGVPVATSATRAAAAGALAPSSSAATSSARHHVLDPARIGRQSSWRASRTSASKRAGRSNITM